MDYERVVRDVRAMRSAGSNLEDALRFMRVNGMSQLFSIRALREIEGIGLQEADQIIAESSTWSDQRGVTETDSEEIAGFDHSPTVVRRPLDPEIIRRTEQHIADALAFVDKFEDRLPSADLTLIRELIDNRESEIAFDHFAWTALDKDVRMSKKELVGFEELGGELIEPDTLERLREHVE